jgi:hypothetical protein
MSSFCRLAFSSCVDQFLEGLAGNNMSKKYKVKWAGKPGKNDYLAALSYLSLLHKEAEAATLVKKLKRAPLSEFQAKDIFRASGLSLLGISNARVKKDQRKIRSGGKLSPILLIRNTASGKVVVADGYHRLCAVYSFDQDLEIPCKIA